MHTDKQFIRHRVSSSRTSILKTIGALVCGGVIGLAVVGAAAAVPSSPPPRYRPFLPPALVTPVSPIVPSTASSSSSTGGSLDLSDQMNAIQQQIAQLLTAGGTAQAGQLANPLCDEAQPSQPFLAWGDASYYTLAPDGDFSTSGEWALNSQATIVSGADPYSGAQQSLQFDAGGQAVSPAICVNMNDSTIRFFIRDLGGNGSAALRVDVVYEGLNGTVQRFPIPIAWVRAGSSWQPSSAIPIWVNLFAAASPSGETAVAFDFTAEGLAQNETIDISSLYVDPFQSL